MEAVECWESVRVLALSVVGRRRRGSPATVQRYVAAVRRFMDFVGYVDADRLIGDIRNGSIDFVELVDARGVGWIDVQLDMGYANKTVHGNLMGVKKWLSVNGVSVDWDRVELPATSVTKIRDRAPSVDELRLMVEHAPQLKDRVAVLCLSSSGLRIRTFLSLIWGDLEFLEDMVLVRVGRAYGRKFMSRGGRGGHGVAQLYVCFFSNEAREALLRYREYREHQGEKITDDSPLIASDLTGEALTVPGFYRRYYLLLERAGLTEKSHNVYVLHVHTLRKYFRSNCVGVDESYREHWMGHRGGYLDESYFRAEKEKHIIEYRKAMPHLALYDRYEVEQLRRELESQREEHSDLERRLREAEMYIEQQRIEQAVRQELAKQRKE